MVSPICFVLIILEIAVPIYIINFYKCIMRRVILISLLMIISYTGFSQSKQKASVEKSTFGIQIGPSQSSWICNEFRLSNQITLRTEIGREKKVLIDFDNRGIHSLKSRSIKLEPRWYYNLNKRVSESKSIAGNIGNYLSLKATYYLDRSYHLEKNEGDSYSFSTSPNPPLLSLNWGIRRNICNHINYEVGVGARLDSDLDFSPSINLRIGYRLYRCKE